MRHAAIAVLMIGTLAAYGQKDPVSRASNQPVEPFRIAGNLFYVGASDVTSYLFVTRAGHILVDGGFEETAAQIQRNIEKLGFRLRDIKIILNSHAHFDHAGGLAELKRATGARLVASADEIPLLARGGLDDPQFGDRFPFPPVHADEVVRDGGRVRLGGTELVAHVTAGHTPGCTSWTTEVRDGRRKLSVVLLCSMTVPPGYRLIGNPEYPDAVADYRAQFRFLRALRPDIPLASHGSFFGLKEKIDRFETEGVESFIDPAGYERLVRDMERSFEAALERETAPAGQ